MVGSERCAERAAASPAAGCTIDVLEGAVAQHLAVGDAVERHAAGEAQVRLARSRARARASSRSTTSSVTAWTDAARSISRWVSGASGLRGGPPNSSSNRALVMVRPVQ